MAENVKIFGYGSLINVQSLKSTVPNAENITPVHLRGYIRIFETRSTNRFTDNNIPICILNLKVDQSAFVNGVCFDVSREYFDSLLEREDTHALKEVQVFSVRSDDTYNAFVFIDKLNEGQNFLFEDPVQVAYLQTCLDGARDIGDNFYDDFLETTHIDNNKLSCIDKLKHLL
jgi:cation transport regulator ChaC